MASKNKNSGGTWKKERASVTNRNTTKAKSNKYRPSSDSKARPAAGTSARYWRAGYTRRDGTKVKGHYVNKAS
jgi:hypothetical protein